MPVNTSSAEFERFRQQVLVDRALQEALRQVVDPEGFAALAVELGRARGCAFDLDAVRAALNAGRRAWVERGI